MRADVNARTALDEIGRPPDAFGKRPASGIYDILHRLDARTEALDRRSIAAEEERAKRHAIEEKDAARRKYAVGVALTVIGLLLAALRIWR